MGLQKTIYVIMLIYALTNGLQDINKYLKGYIYKLVTKMLINVC